MPTDQPNDTLGEPLESGHDELVGEGTKGHRKVKQAELCVGKRVGDERGECLQPFKDEPGSPLRTELKWPPRYASITHNFPCLAPQAEEWRGACRRLFACGRNAAPAAGSWKLPPDEAQHDSVTLPGATGRVSHPSARSRCTSGCLPCTFDFLTSELYP